MRMELTPEQEALLKQIVHAFRTGVGGEEGPTWEEWELQLAKEEAMRIRDEIGWKDDDA